MLQSTRGDEYVYNENGCSGTTAAFKGPGWRAVAQRAISSRWTPWTEVRACLGRIKSPALVIKGGGAASWADSLPPGAATRVPQTRARVGEGRGEGRFFGTALSGPLTPAASRVQQQHPFT